MPWILLFLVGAFVIGLLAFFLSGADPPNEQGVLSRIGTEPQYCSKMKLLSPAEASFFGALKLAVGDQYHVFSKVRLADVIEPSVSRNLWRSAFNQICGKHLDYVICKTGTWDIVAAVELDDASHGRSDRVVRDAFLDFNLFGAGIPLVRVKVKAAYSCTEIREKIAAAQRKLNSQRPAQPQAQPAVLAA
jgi:hypothetical protein